MLVVKRNLLLRKRKIDTILFEIWQKVYWKLRRCRKTGQFWSNGTNIEVVHLVETQHCLSPRKHHFHIEAFYYGYAVYQQ